MTSSPSTVSRAAASVLPRTLRLLVASAGAYAAVAAGAVVVDFNKANDYYAALPTGRVNVVDQYHLGPCEQRLNARDYERAMGECNFILKIFPNHPNALLLMSRTCEQWKSPKCMLDEYFRRAVAINPEAPKTYVIIGISLHDAKQYEKAIQSYKRALEIDPNDMNAHYNLALSYLKTDQFDLANAHAQRAYALGASLPGLRNLLQKSGHWNPAAKPDDVSMSGGPAPASGSAPAKDAASR